MASYVSDVLGPLRRGENATWNTWDWAAGTPGAPSTLSPAPVVIIEGVGAGCAAARELLDALVWVEVADETRKTRALSRDGETFAAHWDRWADQEETYLRADPVPGACPGGAREQGRRERTRTHAAGAEGPAQVLHPAGARTSRGRGQAAGPPQPPGDPGHRSAFRRPVRQRAAHRAARIQQPFLRRPPETQPLQHHGRGRHRRERRPGTPQRHRDPAGGHRHGQDRRRLLRIPGAAMGHRFVPPGRRRNCPSCPGGWATSATSSSAKPAEAISARIRPTPAASPTRP